jgi:O-antigen ligase
MHSMMRPERRGRRSPHDATVPRRGPDFLPLALFTLGIVGYETIALTVSYLDVPSREVSIPYRAAVVALAIIVIVKWFVQGEKIRINVLLLCFFAAYSVRLANDLFLDNVIGADFAMQFFLAAVFLPTIGVCLKYRAGDNDIVVAKALLVMGVVFLGLALWGRSIGISSEIWMRYDDSEASRLGFNALNPISLGHAAACVALAAIYVVMHKSTSKTLRVICVPIVAAGIFVLLESNSRGPLAGFALAVAWYALSHYGRFAFFMPAMLLVSFGGIAAIPAIERTLETFQGGWAVDNSSLGRLEIQEQAIRDFLEEPVFGMHYINPMFGPQGTPHNVLIESAMALGVIGAILLVWLFLVAGLKITQYFGKQHALLTMLFLQHAVNSQLSGAIWNAAAFFMLLGVIVSSKKLSGSERSTLYAGGAKESMPASAVGHR